MGGGKEKFSEGGDIRALGKKSNRVLITSGRSSNGRRPYQKKLDKIGRTT